jgi:hypothetical protein
MNKRKGKVVLAVFFDARGLVYCEFIPEWRTLNKEIYFECSVASRIMRRKRPENGH